VLPKHTVLVGIRNIDEEEKEQIRASGIHAFTMKDIDRSGIAVIAERAIAIASAGTGGIHVSLDLDVCDPTVAPGVGTPVKGGLDYREAHLAMEIVADSGKRRAPTRAPSAWARRAAAARRATRRRRSRRRRRGRRRRSQASA